MHDEPRRAVGRAASGGGTAPPSPRPTRPAPRGPARARSTTRRPGRRRHAPATAPRTPPAARPHAPRPRPPPRNRPRVIAAIVSPTPVLRRTAGQRSRKMVRYSPKAVATGVSRWNRPPGSDGHTPPHAWASTSASDRRPPAARELRDIDAQPVHQAVPDDRRADAAAAGRLAGDGRADPLPPRARVRRALRARARAPARASSRPSNDVLVVRRQRLGRDGVGGRQPRPPRRAACSPAPPASSASAGSSSCDAYGADARRATSRAGASASTRPRSTALLAENAGIEVVFATLVGDLDRRRQRHPGDRRGRRARTARSSSSTRSPASAPPSCARTSGASTSSSPARRRR